jgi:hypothetical protein
MQRTVLIFNMILTIIKNNKLNIFFIFLHKYKQLWSLHLLN